MCCVIFKNLLSFFHIMLQAITCGFFLKILLEHVFQMFYFSIFKAAEIRGGTWHPADHNSACVCVLVFKVRHID